MTDIVAEQALAILTALEALPRGTRLDITACHDGTWHVAAFMPRVNSPAIADVAEHKGESLTDALGQFTTVVILNALPPL